MEVLESSDQLDPPIPIPTSPIQAQVVLPSTEPLHNSTSSLPKRKRKKLKLPLYPRTWMHSILFIWIYNLILTIFRSDLKNVLLLLKRSESAEVCGERLEVNWRREVDEEVKPSLRRALIRTFARQYIPLGILKVLYVIFAWIGNYYFFYYLLGFKQSLATTTPEPIWHGHLYALGLGLSSLIGSYCFHNLTVQCTKIGIQSRAALMVLIYQKSLKLSYVKGGVGDIVNLISVECNRIAEACVFLHYIWSAVFECLVLLVWAYLDIGTAAFAPFALVVFILFPLQFYLAVSASSASVKLTKLITKRVHLMSEILTAIKLIKFNTWEDHYRHIITTMRQSELLEMRQELLFKITSFTIAFATPASMTCLGVFVYHSMGYELTSQRVFGLLFLLNTLRYPLLFLPVAERTMNGAQMAVAVIEGFLLGSEVDSNCLLPFLVPSPVPSTVPSLVSSLVPSAVPSLVSSSVPLLAPFSVPLLAPTLEASLADNRGFDILIEMKEASFRWDTDPQHPQLHSINLKIKRGLMYGIVGDIETGKSLLAALMGQLLLVSGNVYKVEGLRCVFVPMEPWFINASLRENIVFGGEFVEKRYNEAVRLSGLTGLVLSGDDELIQEINLTSSQRQRISLARALYQDDIHLILVEDCLSDFDQTQSKQLFKECFKQVVKGGVSIVLLSWQKRFLKECEWVVVVEGERVSEQGRYEQVKGGRWLEESVRMDDNVSSLPLNLPIISPLNNSPLIISPLIISPSMISPLNNYPLNNSPLIISPLNNYPLISPLNTTINTTINSDLNLPFKLLKTLETLESEESLETKDTPRVRDKTTRLQSIQRKSKKSNKSSPLASSKPINAQPTNLQIDHLNNIQIDHLIQNQLTNQHLNDQIISQIYERNQSSILSGQRPPVNFANQDTVSRTIDHLTMDVQIDLKSPYLEFWRDKPGMWLGYLFLSVFVTSHAFRFVSDVWLIYLVDSKQDYDKNIIIQASLSVVIAIAILLRGFGFLKVIVVKGAVWHKRILDPVLKAPMAFYDVTPIGYILSFFSRHLFSVDEILPDTALQVLSFLPLVLGTLVLACVYVPYLSLIVLTYLAVQLLVAVVCIKVQRVVKASEMASKAPIFAHLSSTLEGLFSIRLSDSQARFTQFNNTLIDTDHKSLYCLLVVKAVMSYLLDSVTGILIYLTSLLIVLAPNITPSETGVALSNVLQLLLFVPWLVKMLIDLDSSMASVSSLVTFAREAPREKEGGVDQIRAWPAKGVVEFKEVTSKYNRYGVSVLKQVSFRIEDKEKIAIVGRSGSGKTSVLMALLRIIETSEGAILIDNVDISKVSLKCLRSRIAIIPQEPVMLTGSIRSNLDPFGTATEAELWEAVEAVHLLERIRALPEKLDTPITENGRVFSISERQLFCIARAILIKSSIVVYDGNFILTAEPVVTVDRDTEKLMLQVLHTNFQHSTVLFLATRFSVILQTDRVIVMKNGHVVESGTPVVLLGDPKSKFSLMVGQAGDVDSRVLRRMVEERERERERERDGVGRGVGGARALVDLFNGK